MKNIRNEYSNTKTDTRKSKSEIWNLQSQNRKPISENKKTTIEKSENQNKKQTKTENSNRDPKLEPHWKSKNENWNPKFVKLKPENLNPKTENRKFASESRDYYTMYLDDHQYHMVGVDKKSGTRSLEDEHLHADVRVWDTSYTEKLPVGADKKSGSPNLRIWRLYASSSKIETS